MKITIESRQLKFWILAVLFLFFIISVYVMLAHDLTVYVWEHLIFAIITILAMHNQINRY